jgi:RHS repeat-associated protein
MQKSATYGGSSDQKSYIASTIAAAFQNDGTSPVNASASVNVITFTARTTGSSTNYAVSTSATGSSYFSGYPSYNASGGALTGGHDAGYTYDSGTVSITVNGFSKSASFGQGSTSDSIATALRSAFNGDGASPVNAGGSGSQVTLTSKVTGSATNYTLSSSRTWNSGTFASASFNTGNSGVSLSGASDGQHNGVYSLSTPYITYYKYDALDNLRCVEQHGDAAYSTVDCTNLDDGVAGGNWRVRKFKYDALSRLLQADNPESGRTGYTYDLDSNVLTKTSPAPNQTGSSLETIKYCYEPLHRVKGKYYSGTGDCSSGFDVQYRYDEASFNGLATLNGVGRRTGMVDASGQTAWSYDEVGRPKTEHRLMNGVAAAKDITYGYNKAGAIQTLTYPSGTVINNSHDGAGRLLSATDSTNNINYATAPAYTASGGLTSLTLSNPANGFRLTNAYNNRRQPTLISADKLGTGTILSRSYVYGSQNNGNILNITDNIVADRSVNYTYDGMNRIASAQSTGSDCSVVPSNPLITKNWGNSYLIDPWGNLTKKPVTKCQSDSLDVTATANNQLNSVGLGLSYDAAGNLKTNAGVTYTYDAENRILTIGSIAYVYDGDGVRVKKSGGSAAPRLYWGESFTAGPIVESDLSGTLNEEYIYFGGKRIARRDLPSGAVHYYFSDHLNSTNLVYSSSGTLEEESYFGPYGEARDYTIGSQNHFKFTGKERDTESGLDYFGARHYGNSLGRFVAPDAALVDQFENNPQSWNLYVYSRNNPLKQSDPSGQSCVKDDEGRSLDDGDGKGCEEGNIAPDGTDLDPRPVQVTATYTDDEKIQFVVDTVADNTSVSSLSEVGRHGAEGAMTAEAIWNLPELFESGLSAFKAWRAARGAETIAQTAISGSRQVIKANLKSLALTEGQEANVLRAIKRATNEAEMSVEKLADGNIKITSSTPGVDTGQSFVKIVDKTGKTLKVEQIHLDNAGRVVVDPKL